jgi:hypothetical protein
MPEVFHRARLRRIGLRIQRRTGLGIDQQAAYAAPAELVGQHQAAGSTAGDQDIRQERGRIVPSGAIGRHQSTSFC